MKKQLIKIDNSKYSRLIKEHIEFLNEERGISKVVQDEAKYLSSLIQDILSRKTIAYDENGRCELAEEYEYNVFETDIKMVLSFVIFDSIDTFNRNIRNVKQVNMYRNEDNTLYLTILCVGNYLALNYVNGMIAHELKHIYQYFRTKRNKINKSIYYNAINYRYLDDNNNLKSVIGIVNDNVLKHFRMVIYLCSKYEHEAYIEELYNELTTVKPKNIYEYINDCNSYKLYVQLKESISELKKQENLSEIYKILDLYKISYRKLIKYAEISLDLFNKKIWKTVSLYNEKMNYYAER